MPDLKISQLNNGNPAQTADQIPINRAGVNFSITAGSISSLATANSADTEVLFNDAGVVEGDPAFTYDKVPGLLRAPIGQFTSTTANLSSIAASSYSLTGASDVPMVDLAGTWNTTGTPTAFKLNITDTASNAASLLADLQIGGSSQFSVSKSGVMTTKTVVADNIIAPNVAAIGQFSWDNNAVTTPVAKPVVTPSSTLISSIQGRMRGCLLLDNGQVNYYLNPTNWAQKANGSASDLTGADGMVMVEIPAFYVKNESSGTLWKPVISATPLPGYDLHPAFIRDGKQVPYRYYSAYDCCVFNGTNFIETDNNNDQSARVNTASDKLVSVSGKYPMAGLTRDEFRLLAENRGAGWSIGDYAIWSAIGILFAVEYQTLASQTAIGVGNTRHTSWPDGGTFATDNRTCQSGFGNALGNASGGSATGTINTSNNGDYVKYRGIENFWGNVWNWTDGIVLYSQGNLAGNKVFGYWSNNTTDFADVANASAATAIPTGYGFLGEFANSLNNLRYATQFNQINTWAMVVTNFSTTSTQGTTDFYRTNSGWRVLRVGGSAASGADAGAFAFDGIDSTSRFRTVGARLAW